MVRQKNINFFRRQAAADRNYERRKARLAAQKLFWQARTLMIRTCGTIGKPSRRMLKKAVQQGRSEWRTEAYPLGYVEGLNDARTPLAAFFSILLGLCCEMGKDPIADRCGHLVKILPPSELVIGSWQEI